MPLALTQTQSFVRALRGLAMAGAALALASCAQKTGQYGQYGQLGDAKPHPAVTKAHKMPVQGIDVSRWQGKIDWASVAAAGKQFAFIKATEGGDHIDPRFLENWHGAKQAGLVRGAYHFVYWCRSAATRRAGSSATSRTIRARCRRYSTSSGTTPRRPARRRWTKRRRSQ
jgi:lysozyme